MTSTPTPTGSTTDPADDRDGRVVGEEHDSALESLGKAIVAPVEGADEERGRERPFTDLTQTLPQGEDAIDDPTLPRDKPPL